MEASTETKAPASTPAPDMIPIRRDKGEKQKQKKKKEEEETMTKKKASRQNKKFTKGKPSKGKSNNSGGGEKKKRVRKHKVIEIDPNNPPPFQLPKKKLSAKRMEKWLKYAPRRPVKVSETPEEREARHASELSATLFVRNLPLSSEEKDLEDTFSRYGKLQYCKIVTDRESGVSKGTGFVCFADKEGAQHTLDEAYPSYWENSVGGESCISLGGRQLAISWAVNKAEAERLSSITSGERRKLEKPRDKRNMALAEVGYLKKEEMESRGFGKVDIARRLSAQADKMARLSNPNLFVSPTRLSVRYIPPEMTEKELKQIAREAGALNGKNAVPKQVKIVMDKLRVNSETGKPRSKCFGFVEYATPEEARAALDVMNNNKDLFGGKTLPLVDYAVENVFAVNKLNKSIQKSKDFAAKHSGEEPVKRDRKRQRENRKKGKKEKKEAEAEKTAETTPEEEEKEKSKTKKDKKRSAKRAAEEEEKEEKEERQPARKIPRLSAPKWRLDPKLREKKEQEFLEKKAQKKALRKERVKTRKEEIRELKSKIKTHDK